MLRLSWLLAAAALLAGCATNPMTGRSQLHLVSEESAIAQSASAYDAMLGEYRKQNKISEDEALNRRVRGIADRLIQQAVRYRPDAASWHWTIEVIDEPKTVNAFCMPGGRMAVYTGLIEKVAPTDDELAQVVGHEIAHALAGHGAEKMSMQLASNVAVLVVSAAARSNDNNRNQGTYNAATLAALAFVNLPNSRTAESEADRLGIELAARAGYDPRAAASLWEKMMQATDGGKSRFDFLSTHPAPPKRIEALRALEPHMEAFYAAARHNPPPRAWTSLAANEKQVGETEAPEGPAIAFYSAAMERFEQGTLRLECDDNCATSFMLDAGDLRRSYDARDWRALAQGVIKTKYRFDLAYFYLAAAADGFGYRAAARTYAAEAMRLAGEKDTACAHAVLLGCGGIDVRHAALRLIGAR